MKTSDSRPLATVRAEAISVAIEALGELASAFDDLGRHDIASALDALVDRTEPSPGTHRPDPSSPAMYAAITRAWEKAK